MNRIRHTDSICVQSSYVIHIFPYYDCKCMEPKIFVADDDSAIASAIQLILESEDFRVVVATEGDVTKSIKRNHPDLVLLDIWMSGQDGRDICKRLKKDVDTSEIPIILVSASRDVERSTLEAGADDFIIKPFEMMELIQKVRHYTIKNKS